MSDDDKQRLKRRWKSELDNLEVIVIWIEKYFEEGNPEKAASQIFNAFVSINNLYLIGTELLEITDPVPWPLGHDSGSRIAKDTLYVSIKRVHRICNAKRLDKLTEDKAAWIEAMILIQTLLGYYRTRIVKELQYKRMEEHIEEYKAKYGGQRAGMSLVKYVV